MVRKRVFSIGVFIVLVFCGSLAFAQDASVNGTVVDETKAVLSFTTAC